MPINPYTGEWEDAAFSQQSLSAAKPPVGFVDSGHGNDPFMPDGTPNPNYKGPPIGPNDPRHPKYKPPPGFGDDPNAGESDGTGRKGPGWVSSHGGDDDPMRDFLLNNGNTPPGTTPPGSELQTPPRFNVSPDWPTLNLPPAPNVGPRPTPTPFSYDPYAEGTPFDDGPAFSAPTVQDAESEPGYAFGKEQGLGAMRNALSAQGTFRTGGTPKAFFQWADQYAQQNYGRVYDRAAQAHDRARANRFQTWGGNELQRANQYTTNRGNAFEGWKANNQLEGDVFDDNRDLAFNTFNAESARQQGMFAPKQRQAELTFDDMWKRFQAGLDAKTRIAIGGD